MSTASVTTRFAPSPTGLLHLGNARTALFNWLLARQSGGRFVLRLEDTDAARSLPEHAAACLEDLRWLGLGWDAGPDAEDARGPYRQSARAAVYAGLVHQLQAAGQVYECYCSPVELAVARRVQLESGRPPRYAGTCRHLGAAQREAHRAAGRQPTLRFCVPAGETVTFHDLVRGPQAMASGDIGDFVLTRADGSAAFFFANAVDDALMGITHVLRGEDHLANTYRQVLLLGALGLPVPTYGHLSLLGTAGGGLLSKREGATSLADLRARGFLPAALRNFLARLGHSYADPGWLDDAGLATGFRTDHLGRAPAQVDEAQLRHWQHEAVQRAGIDQLRGWWAGQVPVEAESAFLDLVRGNLTLPEDARYWAGVVFGREPVGADPESPAGASLLATCLAAYDTHGPDLKAMAAAVLAATGARGKAFFHPLRLALTGRDAGPELGPLLRLMPPAIVRARLQAGFARPGVANDSATTLAG